MKIWKVHFKIQWHLPLWTWVVPRQSVALLTSGWTQAPYPVKDAKLLKTVLIGTKPGYTILHNIQKLDLLAYLESSLTETHGRFKGGDWTGDAVTMTVQIWAVGASWLHAAVAISVTHVLRSSGEKVPSFFNNKPLRWIHLLVWCFIDLNVSETTEWMRDWSQGRKATNPKTALYMARTLKLLTHMHVGTVFQLIQIQL